MKIDRERCVKAMANLEVSGDPARSMRKALIEEAIQAIQERPDRCFTGEYLGIKNYAHFGDQREDHAYGMCPRHGSIVFRVGRTRVSLTKADLKCKTLPMLGADEIYLLECYRDFGMVKNPEYDPGLARQYYIPEMLNLCQALHMAKRLSEHLKVITDAFEATEVDLQGEG